MTSLCPFRYVTTPEFTERDIVGTWSVGITQMSDDYSVF